VSQLVDRLQCRNVSITKGSRGALTYSTDDGLFEVPVFSHKIVDTIGAGDAFLAITAPCVADGFPMDVVGFIGNTAGALAVQILGNRSALDPVQVYKSITAMLQ
jgi:sugar/nucleoside kinase (ribokinase family)